MKHGKTGAGPGSCGIIQRHVLLGYALFLTEVSSQHVVAALVSVSVRCESWMGIAHIHRAFVPQTYIRTV
jgi:hypothetical protein